MEVVESEVEWKKLKLTVLCVLLLLLLRPRLLLLVCSRSN